MRRIKTRQVAFSAMFTALAALLSIYPFTFYLPDLSRITFREIPIYLCSLTLGPVWGGLCAFASDLIGTFISNSGNAWNPMFALSAVLSGVLPGLLFHYVFKREKLTLNITLSIVPVNIAVSLFLTTFWFQILGYTGGMPFWAYLLIRRLWLVAIMTVIQILAVRLLYPVVRLLYPIVLKEGHSRRKAIMTYEEAIAYIHGMYWRGSKLGLVRVTELCELLGNPQNKLKFIHVAGTNGKGSTCAMLSRILTSQGYRTGLFVSPYVDRFNERIQFNNEPIADDELCEIITELKPVVESMENAPTEFEVITAAAFLYYVRKKCDYVVLEVGLGGELDSTNIIKTPLLSIITAIDYDHMHILGDTIQEIASAKAGIIKDDGNVLFYGQHPDALPVIEAACEKHHACLHVVDRSTLKEGTYDLHGQTFDYKDYRDLKLGLLGKYQMCNAATVVDAVELLREQGVEISDEALRTGLRETVWPARFELLREDPPFFVDGGHNPHGVRGTVETYQRLFPETKAKIVMGMMRDKDVSQSVKLLLPIAKTFYTVRPDNDRAMPAEELAELIRSLGAEATPFDTVAAAVETACKGEGPVLAVGSLYMAGEVHQAFRALTTAGGTDA